MVKKRICPKCKSYNVSLDMTTETLMGQSTLRHFKCNECGFISAFFPEINENNNM